MSENIQNKSKAMRIISFVVVAVFAVAIVTAIIALNVKVNNSITTVTVSPSAYAVGILDDTTGKTPTEQENIGIFSKNYLPVNGLKCQLSTGATIRYQVNFYDVDHNYIGVKTYTTDYTTLPTESVYQDAKYVKIEIFPTADEDGVVSVFEVSKYAKMLTVTYNK